MLRALDGRASGGSTTSATSGGRLRSESAMLVRTHSGHSTDTPTGEPVNWRSKCSDSDSATTACLVA